MKRYRKILLYTGLAAAVVLAALSLSVFLFKDRIVGEFIRNANTYINTPIRLKKIDVSLFRHFPDLSIVFYDVYIEDSHPGEYPLLTADRIAFRMNPWEVYRGKYNIRGLSLTNSEATLKIDENGINNYTVTKTPAGGSGTTAISLALEDIKLESTSFIFSNREANENLSFTSKQLVASIRSDGSVYSISADGELKTESIVVDGGAYLSGKLFRIDSEVIYNDEKRSLLVKPSRLDLNKGRFRVSGSYEWKGEPAIELSVEGENTDIQTLFSLLPEKIASRFDRYQSKGEIYFKAVISGVFAKESSPGLKVDFGFDNATIFHPDYQSRIEKARLKGRFESSDLSDERFATLRLDNLEGLLNTQPFRAALAIRNFSDPDVSCSFTGKVDAGALFGFYPVENVSEVSGSLLADVSFRGKTELLRKKTTAQNVATLGSIELQGINLKYGSRKVPVKDLKGSLQFSNNDLAMSNVSGKYGNTDFLLNGFFKNVITFLLFEGQPIGIEADLKSRLVDADQLFEIGYGSGGQSSQGDSGGDYEFDISKNVYLNFNCDISSLRYKKFHAEKIRGDLLVKNKVAVSRKLSFSTMGGKLEMSGIVDSNNPKAIDVLCSSKLSGIHLDSVFYVFENFGQDFIHNRHLKGQVTADVNLEMVLNQNLRLFSETLIADISAAIKNGELNNFEPMRKLNKYLDDEGLSRLRFSDLNNDIHIENKTVYIPQMDIRSNVTDIRISGTHTFDQRIDYRVVTPLRGKSRATAGEASNAIGEDGKGQLKLFLKITGTTENYRIAYDTEAVKKKIISDLKKEVKELKDAFRHKETQKKKEVEVQEDEYFDW